MESTSMNKRWFGPRKFGYGVTPISWEGWTCVAVLVLAMTALILHFS